jgi:alcohol dehydrogenase (cytochrome c)
VTGIPGKTGIVYTLDARTGEFLWARETIHQNVVADIDTANGGRVTINESLIARPFQETFVCPSLGGGKNWPSGAYSPLTRTMYQPQQNLCMRLTGNTDKPTPEDGYATSWIIVQDPAVSAESYPVGRLDAVSIETGRTLWVHEQRAGMLGSLMATAGGLVFGGDIDRRFTAFDDRTGQMMWQAIVEGPVSGHPVSYEIDKRQYIAVPVGGNTASPERRALSIHPEIKPPAGVNALFVFALPLPERRESATAIYAMTVTAVAAALLIYLGVSRRRRPDGQRVAVGRPDSGGAI